MRGRVGELGEGEWARSFGRWIILFFSNVPLSLGAINVAGTINTSKIASQNRLDKARLLAGITKVDFRQEVWLGE